VYGRGYILFGLDGKPFKMYGSISDITERKRLERELVNEKVNRQKLITDITIQAQEKERNELGKELHDNINQMLATVKLYLGMVISDESRRKELLPVSYKYVNETIEEIRKLSKTLVAPSLGDSDLEQALEDLVDEVNLANKLHVELFFNIDKNVVIDDKKKLMLYRIVQEQLTNIRKHAEAQEATVRLQSMGDDLYLSIKDDGKGFDPEKKANGIGLRNITSRVEFYAGTVNIISAPGEGCTIEIVIPNKVSS
jgi:two-component system sensor histidine kinase UhpB